MADQEEDDLFNEFMAGMDEEDDGLVMDDGGDEAAEEKEVSEPDPEPASKSFKEYFTLQNISQVFTAIKEKVQNRWQFPFMVLSIIGSFYVWFVIPDQIDEEDRIHEPNWWFERAIHYYDIAADKGIEKTTMSPEFSVFEFPQLAYNEILEEEVLLLDLLKKIEPRISKIDKSDRELFLNSLVGYLNKLLMKPNLYETIPEELANTLTNIDANQLEKYLGERNNSVEAMTPSQKLDLQKVNRKILEELSSTIPKFKEAHHKAGLYFSYVFEKYPKYFYGYSAENLLKAADTFNFILKEYMSKKDVLAVYNLVLEKTDPLSQSKQRGSLTSSEYSFEDRSALKSSDQNHTDYQVGTLNYSLGNFHESKKSFLSFLEAALEKTSLGSNLQQEKGIESSNDSEKTPKHREIDSFKTQTAYFKLGSIYYKEKKFSEALDSFRQYLTSNAVNDPENNFTANHFSGDINMQFKDYDKALKHYVIALKNYEISNNQKNPIRYKAGLAHYKLNEFQKSIDRFISVKGTGEYDLYNDAAIYYRGKSYLKLNQEKSAIEMFRRITDRNRSSQEGIAATLEISKYHFRQKEYDLAFSAPKTVEIGKKVSDNSIKTLLESHSKKQFTENKFLNVDDILAQADSETENIGLLYDLARAFTTQNKSERAIEVYKLMTENPLTIDQMGNKIDLLYFDMAKIFSENQKPIEAGDMLLTMIDKVPHTKFLGKALWDACRNFMYKKDYGRAIVPLRRYVNEFYSNPEFSEAHYLLGICEKKVGGWEQAIKEFETSYGYIAPKEIGEKEVDGKKVPVYEEMYNRLGRATRPIDFNVFAFKSIFEKGLALKQLGYYQKAIDHLNDSVFNDPLARFSPRYEIWKRALLVIGQSYYELGWREKDPQKKEKYFEKSHKNFIEYVDRYPVPTQPVELKNEFDELLRDEWEQEDLEYYDLQFLLADMAMVKRDYTTARNLYKKLSKWKNLEWSKPNQRDDKKKLCYMRIPLTYFLENDWKQAIPSYRESKDRYSQSPEAPYLGIQIALCFKNLGDINEAKKEFRTSGWILDSLKDDIFSYKPGGVNKQFWLEVLKLQGENLKWLEENS